MITSELAVLVCPGAFLCNRLHNIPMLGDLTVLNTPKIIVGSGSAAEGTFGNSKNVVALHHIVKEVLYQLTVFLGLVQILQLAIAVDLSVAFPCLS